MAGILLISEAKLKSFTNINKNLDMDVLRAEIQISQDIELQPILGTKFYNKLLSRVSITGSTFSAEEKTLVDDYVAPFLIQISYYNAIPHIHFRTMNRGIVEGQMEGAQAVDLATMQYLRGIQKQRADFYRMRLLDYLTMGQGQNKFPDYINVNSLDGMAPDKSQKYNNPIVLNHTTRRGFSNRYQNNLESYSENERSNGPDCEDC